MAADVMNDLMIALDYYDGEVEGFARFSDGCSYFKRVSVDVDINAYSFVLLMLAHQ